MSLFLSSKYITVRTQKLGVHMNTAYIGTFSTNADPFLMYIQILHLRILPPASCKVSTGNPDSEAGAFCSSPRPSPFRSLALGGFGGAVRLCCHDNGSSLCPQVGFLNNRGRVGSDDATNRHEESGVEEEVSNESRQKNAFGETHPKVAPDPSMN